jgi:hypothetical protein
MTYIEVMQQMDNLKFCLEDMVIMLGLDKE